MRHLGASNSRIIRFTFLVNKHTSIYGHQLVAKKGNADMCSGSVQHSKSFYHTQHKGMSKSVDKVDCALEGFISMSSQ
jgi:hypothetical protein